MQRASCAEQRSTDKTLHAELSLTAGTSILTDTEQKSGLADRVSVVGHDAAVALSMVGLCAAVPAVP
jgi:hypothetical protein